MNSFKSHQRKRNTSNDLNTLSSCGTATSRHTPSTPQEQDMTDLHAGHSLADFTIHGPNQQGAAAPVQKVDVAHSQGRSVGLATRFGESIAHLAIYSPIESPTGIVIQRVINPVGFADQEQLNLADQAQLQAITDAVANYNGVAVNDIVADLQQRFSLLEQLDRLIYHWFNTHPSQDLVAVPYGPQLRTLLQESENERDQVVATLRQQNASIPFANLGEGENPQALWNSIVGQGGHLKILGTAAKQDKIYGRLASILQTPSGRKFLHYADRLSPHDISILFTGTPEQQERDPRGAAAPGSSYAFHFPDIDDVEANKPDKLRGGGGGGIAVTNQYQYVAEMIKPVGGAEARAASMDINGTSYQYGGGMGSFAAISPSPVLDDNRAKASDQQGNEVVTPTFISLMHELGHSMKMAAGAYLSDTNAHEAMEAIIGTQFDQDLWGPPGTRLEEFVNIKGIENPVRQESGLNTRDYYETPEQVQLARAKQAIYDQWDVIKNRDPEDVEYYLAEAYRRCQTAMALPNWIKGAQNMADLINRNAPIQDDLALTQQAQLTRKRTYLNQLKADFEITIPPGEREFVQNDVAYRSAMVNADAAIASALGRPIIRQLRGILADLQQRLPEIIRSKPLKTRIAEGIKKIF